MVSGGMLYRIDCIVGDVLCARVTISIMCLCSALFVALYERE